MKKLKHLWRSFAFFLTLAGLMPLAADAQTTTSTFDELQAEVTALKKQEVAWRQIQWRTCLLDGIAASREQKKPLMLWVFIDRPIDDERC